MTKLDLSIYQKNFYLEWRMDPDSSKYNTCLTFEINGPLNIQALKQTVFKLINHSAENPRTYFIEENGKIKQVIVDKLDVKIEEYDLSSMDKELIKKESDKILHDIYNHAFDLHKLPLFRYGLIKLGNEKFIFVLNHHHITCDAFSASYLIDYVSGKYNELAFGESFDAETLPKIKDYIDYEKEDYSQAERDKDLVYWQQELSDVPLRVDIPDMKFDKKEGMSKEGGSHYFNLDLETSNKLRQFARANRATPFLVLSAIWALLSSRYSGQKDIIIHYPINARPPKFKGLLGCFVNAALMKVDVDQTKTVSEFIKSVVQKRKDTKAYQRASLSDIVQSLRSSGIYEEGAFNLSIVEAFIGSVGLNLKKCKSKGVPSALQYLNDLALAYQYDIESEVFQFRLDYKTSILDTKGAKKLEFHLKNIINEFIKDNQILLCDIDLLESKERKQILIDWNDTKAPYPKDKTIHELFEEQVKKTPDNIAVVFEDEKLSYKDLNKKSNQLAHLIRAKYKKQNKKDLKPDSLIGLCVERSLDMIIGILGILKAGAAYVPLDPDYPQDRLEYMIEDSHEGLIITQKDIVTRDKFLDQLHHDELLIIDSDEVKAELKAQSTDNLEKVNGPNDLAYVIYTSGSTGRPKGVMVEHDGVINLSEIQRASFDCNKATRSLQFAPFSFDAASYEIFVSLTSGGELYIVSSDIRQDGSKLADYIEKNKINLATLPPALLSVFPQVPMPSLKSLVIAGDTCDQLIMEFWSKGRCLINAYGPTESTVCASMHKYNQGDSATNIGKPNPNARLYILDENLNPCPVGAPGELYIGGAGLARGYLNQEELTKERFIPNPFAKELCLPDSDRIYKTGDLVRWLPDGNIEYLGRTDFQVKIRGFRIELGEIENTLAQHSALSQVTVIDKDKEGQKYLAAYYVVDRNKEAPEVEDLRVHLVEKLPDYMVPAAFVKLDEMPLTPNGKINRKALPDPDMSLMGEEYVAPRNEIEEKLVEVWSTVLKLEKDKIGIHDNFFHLGGHSLLAIQLVSRIHAKLNCELTIKQLFDQPKLIDLAELIAKQIKEGARVAYSPIKKSKRLETGNAMSFAQERLWFLDQFEGQSANYNIPMVLRLEGKLNVKALEASINQLIARHDSLRTVFSNNKDGVGVQKIRGHLKLKLSVQKIDTNANTKAIESAIETAVHAEIHRPFDLEKGPLVRVCLYKVKSNAHVFVFNHHHIISDGVSIEILLNDLSEFYQANIEKREATLEKLPIQYVDFAAWQRAEFEKPDYQNKLQYWQERLSGYSDLPLPVDKARPKTFTYQGSDFNFSLDKALSDQLVKLARENGTTLYMVLLTAFNVFLSRYSGSDDIILGSPIANRYHHDTEGLVGFFVNTLILRNEVDSNQSVKALLSQISQDTLSAFDHQMVPFEQIVEQLDVTRDTSRNPIVQVLFSLQSFGQDTSGNIALNLPGISITPYDQTGYDVAKFDLSLFFSEGKNGLVGNFNYCTDLFHQETIERMARNFERLLGAIVKADADTQVKDLRLLTDERRQQILIDWNDTKAPYPKDKTIHELFEAQVKKTPKNIAVVFEDKELSYQALNEKANQLARLIRAKYKKQNKQDLKPDSLIGLCVERSLDMIIGILGIIKAGAAYVPLDPDYPQDRLEYMIEDSHEGLIITQKEIVARDGFLDQLHHEELLIIDSDEIKAELEKQSAKNLEKVNGPNDLAYVIYTSGSTGRPKGVMVPHQGVINLMSDLSGLLEMDAKSRFLSLTSMNFDIFVLEYTLPLFNGSTCIVLSESNKRDVESLKELFNKHQPNFVQATPSMWGMLSDHVPKMKQGLKLLTGGENLSNSLKDKLLNIADDIYNVYGPTETTIWSTYTKCQKDKKVTIGKPFANTQIYILDNNLNPCSIGAPGELYIGGGGVTQGYFGQEELTKERFIPNPFADEVGLPKSDRIYKTGDLVRWLPDGNIEYLGRTDFQVKIRGFRIELGEIENTLAQHSALSQVTVIDKDKEGQKYLAAYYVVGKGKKSPEVEELRAYLAEKLPDYMVPAAFVKLDEMPLTPNGKINRKALPDPDMSLMGEEYVAHRNEIEQKLADIWCEVLKLEQIGIHDNFFHLGGHSLLAIQLVSHIHARFNCELSIKQLFDQPKLIDLAELIAKKVKEGAGVAYSPIKKTRRLKSGNAMSFAQERLWFLDQFEGQSANYNIPMVLRLEGQLNVKALEASINQLIARHDSLRTVFSKNKDGVGVQKVLENLKLKLAVQKIDTKGNTKAIESAIETAVHAEIHCPFDLEKGPLVRVCLYKVISNAHVFVFNHHHIISDGVSTEILINDLSEFYQANIEKREPTLEKLPIQYVDFAAWQRAEFEKPDYQKKLEYWQERLLGYSNLPLPVDKARPKTFTYQGSDFNFSLDKVLSDQLVKLAQENGTTIYMVLLTAFNVFLSRYSGSDDIILGSPIANRYHHDTEGLVGFFVNTLILRNEVDSNQSVKALLSQISQDTLSAFDHQMVPFEQIVEQLDVTRDTSRNPIVQVMFSLQSFGQDTSGNIALNLPGISITPYDQTGYDVAKFDLSLFFSEGKNGLVGNFNYCTDLFHQETIERMARNFERLLGAIVKADADTKVKDLRLLTDERRQQILIDWNDTAAPYPKDKTIHELFEAQVKKTPKNIAVVFEDKELSYQALNEKANQLARLIRAKYKKQNKQDLKPDSLIGLCVERSLDMIIGILGILKAGAAYVPLDPDYPQDRLEYMIEDSHEGLIITQKEIVARDGFLDQLHHDELLVIDSYDVKKKLKKESTDNLPAMSGPNDLAYVIYTSGSTGRPKGVMVEHKSVNRLVCNSNYVAFSDSDKVLQAANISFDAATFEIWGALLNGLTLVQISQNYLLNITSFKTFLEDQKISIMWMTVALFNQYVSVDPSIFGCLKYLLVGGDALSPDKITKLILGKNTSPKYILNGYGPTESTTFTTTYSIKEVDGKIPIGTPINNTTCYILEKNNNPCPIGAPGELYIGGAGLARGYLNQEELTKERFIPNPFAKEVGLPETDRLYKTGDLVRWLPDGNIEYLGRTDFQVKIRGFRIELGEIENTLAQHEDISQVTVIDKEKEGQKYLAAYYVVGKGKKLPEVEELRAYLAEKLPDYMVPAAFVKLDEMPLTPNGKINRRALPDPDMSLMGEEYVAPRNELEEQLAQIWCDILKLEQIGIHDNFFSMGGDSIISIQLVSRARDRDLYFTPKDLFQNPTIAQLAVIDLKGSVVESEQGLVSGEAALIPIQSWFFEQAYAHRDHWNQAQLLQVGDSLDVDCLEAAFLSLIHHHDALRLRYKTNGKVIEQYYDDAQLALNIKVQTFDLSKSKNLENELTEHCSAVQASLNIASGPVLAAAVFKGLGDGKDRLLIAIHHLMVDGVSWRIILPDLESCYQQIKAGKAVKLSPKTSSYQDWGHALHQYTEHQAIDDLDYWLTIAQGIKPLAYDLASPLEHAEDMDHVSITWDKAHTQDLLSKTQQAYNTQINDLLLSAFALALANWQQIDRVSFNLEGHGREDAVSGVDLSRSVGWFTSLFPVTLNLPEIEDLNHLTAEEYKACIQSIKEQIRQIPDKGLSYGVLKYLHPDQSIRDQFKQGTEAQVSFNYLGQFGDAAEQTDDGWGFAAESSGATVNLKNHHPNVLDLNGMVVDGQLSFSVAFSTDHFKQSAIDQFSQLFKQCVIGIVEHCVSQDEVAYTPSDFATAQLSQGKLDEILSDKSVDKIYALSPLQEGMLFHALHAQDSDQYCVQLEWTYEGQLDPDVLKTAWDDLIHHHDILRTRFIWQAVECPIQVVEQSVETPWFVEDLSPLNAKEQRKQLKAYALKDRFLGFDLSKPCVMRLHLIKLSEREYHFIWTNHHILLDGWCNPILLKELSDRYAAIRQGKTPVVRDAISYERYIEFIKAQDKKEAEKFWADALGEIEGPTDIKVQKAGVKLDPNKPIKDLGSVKHCFDIAKTKEMEDFAKVQKVTINSFVQLAWANTLSRYSGESDVIYGSVLSGRSQALFGIDQMVGLLINTLPMVVRIDGNQSIAEHLRQVHQRVQEVNDYAYCGLSEVQRFSQVASGNPLFNVLFVFENYPTGEGLDESDWVIKDVQSHEKTNYPISVMAYVSRGQLELKIDYDKACFSDEVMASLLRHMTNFMLRAILEANQAINQVKILDVRERQQILIDWNDTAAPYPKDKTIHELFEAQAKRTPNNIAVVFEDEQLTYQALNEKANQLARLIRAKYKKQNKKDLKPDSLIGLCVERSLDMIIGILGIIKAGAAYVPLDPDYPQDRLEYMIEDSHEGLIITQKEIVARDGFLDQLHHDELLVIDSYDVKKKLKKESTDNLPAMSGPNDLAYVIYTSGSTGRPKGVMVAHSSVSNYMHWLHGYLDLDDQTRSDCSSNLAFDFTLSVSVASLIKGHEVCLCSDDKKKDLSQYVRHIIDNNISYAKLTPGYLSILLEYIKGVGVKLPLRKIILGGEALKIKDVSDWLDINPGCKFYNEYGPTEATVGVSQHTYTLDNCMESVGGTLIGDPGVNIRYYVLGANLSPCPIGAPGELYIGGAGLARGYLNQEELTKERFIPNPFAKEVGLPETDRIYKTGDLVRWLPDGNIEYLGRTDFQVKIRGFRIELGEIENTLAQHEDISQVTVIDKDKEGQKYLAAYYVTDKEEPEVEDLRAHLAEKLPDYMVPAAFVKLDKMPLTPNGKVNRKALPDPDMSLMGEEYVAPRNELEEKLTEVWTAVLKLEQDKIGIHDNFFSMGGDSIISIQLVSRARDRDLYFTPKDLFQNPTIAQLAVIDLKGSVVESEQGLVSGEAALIPIQHWFFEQAYAHRDHSNQAQLLQVGDSLDVDCLEAAFLSLIHHHDALRLRYRTDGKGIQQYYDDAQLALNIKVQTFDLSKSKNLENELTEHCSAIQASLNIASGPVLAAAVFKGLGDGKDRLLIAIHHLMVDGVSWRIILPDLESCYQQIKAGKAVKLSPKTSSYQDWGHALHQYAEHQAIDDLDYWLATAQSIKPLAYGLDCPLDHAEHMDRVSITWDKAHTQDLLSKTQQAYNTQINDLLLSAFALALANWQQIDRVSFNLEGHGREDAVSGVDLSRSVGWFTSLFPVTLNLPEIEDLNHLTAEEYKSCIQSIKEQIRQIPDKGLSYGVLKYLHPDQSIRDQFKQGTEAQVSFNYLGQFGDAAEQTDDGWGFAAESSGAAVNLKNHHPNVLDLNGMVVDGQLSFSVAFSTDHFKQSAIDQFSQLFKQCVLGIVEHCVSQDEVAYTPSDFATAQLSQGKLDEILSDKSVDKIYALSPLQEGMLFHALHAQDSDQYCVQLEWTYEGQLDPDVLKTAWDDLIHHHDILRTRFIWQAVECPIQVVEQSVETPWFVEDLSPLNAKEQRKQLKAYALKDRFLGFDLSKPCVMRLHLIKLSEREYHFIWTNHHILLDGWCNPILLKELSDRYAAIRQGKTPVVRDAISYERYIEFIKAQDKKEAEKFWADALGEIEGPTDIKVQKAGVKLDPNQPIKDLGSVKHCFDIAKTKEMEDFAKVQKVTINSFVQLAWANTLSRYSGESDVIYGSVLSGRSQALFGIDQMVGLLINTLPMVVRIDGNQSIAEHLRQVHQRVQEVNDYAYCGLSEVQRFSQVASGNPLFNVLFVFENYPTGEGLDESDWVIKDVQSHEKTNYPISVMAYVSRGQLELKIDYDKACFSDEVMASLLRHMTNFMLRAILEANQAINQVKILDVRERQQILIDWNDTAAPYPKDKTIHELFEAQAKRTPNNIAVVFEDEQLTYQALNEKANQLARLIRAKYKKQNKKDLKPDSLIGLCVERSLDMIIGILGILKAGAAYVPLDPDYPQDRLEYMIADSHEGLIITQKDILAKDGFLDKLHHDELLVIDADGVKAELSKQSDANLDTVSGPDSLAYVIYTSGSTGQPKGVMIEHAGALNRINWMHKEYGLTENDKVLQKTPFSFDVSVWELLWPIMHGGQLIFSKRGGHKDPEYLLDSIERFGITKIHFVPSMLQGFMDYMETDDLSLSKITSLNDVFCSGEALSLPLAMRVINKLSLKINNLYGPTEAPTASSYDCSALVTCDLACVPIGRAINNTKLYILDGNLKTCPIGTPGELHIGGAGLARGYLNQEALTNERFISNPFAPELGFPDTDRIYKTGDLVRWLPDGNIEYLGRTDFQVKIRGFRIELGEIENTLSQHDVLSQVTVVALEKEGEGQKYLAAYYVVAKDSLDPSIDELRDHLSATLPDYMVPTAFMKLDAMPLTPNGKINRRALPDPDMSLMAEEYVAPRNEIEQKLADIWAELLKIDKDKVGVHDNFFHLGGHSLLAIQLVARVHATLNADISIKALFDKPKLMDLALFIDTQIKEGAGKAYAPIKKTEVLKSGNAMSFAQERLWFLDQFEGSNENYNIPLIFRLHGSLDIRALTSSINQLIARHDSFRTIFIKNKEGVGVQKILDIIEIKLDVEKLKAKYLEEAVQQEINSAFDLMKGPLLRARLFKVSQHEHVFVFNHHHIISDGVSVGIISTELSEFYQAHIEKRAPKLADLPIRYVDFAAWQREEFNKPEFQEKLTLWSDHLANYSDLQLPLDKKRPAHFSYKGAHIDFSLDEELSDQLAMLAQQHGTTLYTVLLMAFNLLLSRHSGQDDIVIGSPIANRYHHDIESLIGFFVNTLILRTEIDSNQSVEELLKQIASHALEAFDNQEVPFEQIVEVLGVTRDTSRNPIIQVMFSLQSFGADASGEAGLSLPGIKVAPYSEGEYDVAKFDLSLFMQDSADGLMGHFEYCTDLFNPDTIEQMMRHFERLLQSIVSDSKQKVKDLRLLTDERRQQILVDWNDTQADYPKDKTIYQLFEEQAHRTPNNIAVVFEDQQLTYLELNQRANQLAQLIRKKYKQQHKKELKADSLIGLCVERSLDIIVGILGILKAGAAYVPLDPDYPQDRLEYIIEDSHEGLIITQKKVVAKNSFLDKLHHDELLVIDSDEVKKKLKKQNADNLPAMNGANDLAYVIYTSGSTGKPKGVMIEHHSLINLYQVQRELLGCNKDTRSLQYVSLSFDVSVSEIFISLASGGELYIVSSDIRQDGGKLVDYLEKNKINLVSLPAKLLTVLPKASLPHLKTINVGGDKCKKTVMDFWSQDRFFINAYGPTESTVCASMHKYERGDSATNIGKPNPNARLYILDNNHNPCPIGTPGELYIGGAGLARGYLNQEKLTKERFISNPFAKELGLPNSDRIYKTSDLVRWLPDGNIEFIGRADFQVKIRGFRVELGEIENTLAKYNSLSQVTVAAFDKKDQKYLAAYYVVAKDTQEPSIDELRDYLSETLPDYMVPTAFMKLDKMPLTPNGKINRKALPDPDLSLMAEKYVAPRNEIEQQLADIWCELLNVEQVGIHDNFFHMGGQSLLTIQLTSKINLTFEVDVTLAWAFKNLTIAQQASSIIDDRLSLVEYQPIIRLKQLKGDIPLFLIHPGAGGVEVYQSMATLFNTNSHISEIYGIDSYNFYHTNKPMTDLKLLAKQYIEHIKSYQQKGPYFISGWSLGGTIAYEIAHQLKRQGECVAGVYLIDTLGVKANVWSKIYSLISQDEFINTLKEKKESGLTNTYIKKLIKLHPIEQSLLSKYTLREIEDIEVVLMQAVNYITSNDKKFNELTDIPKKGWGQYTKNLTVHKFDANHVSIMQGEHLKRLVKIIEDDMNKKIELFLKKSKQ